MSSLFAMRALLFAGECFAASIVLLAFAWIASAFVKQAAMRHFVWLTAFGVLLVLPAVALIVPARIVIAHKTEASAPVPTYVEISDDAAASVPITDAADTTAAPEQEVSSQTAPTPAVSSWKISAGEIALGAFALWLAGFLVAAARIARGFVGLRMLRRTSRPHTLDYADLPFTGATARECELRISNREDGPMAWGFFRPVILLPKSARAWPRERLQAVLLHELAHVRRRDGLMQMLSLLACAVYWFNPLMWIGVRALRREAEIAADDAVIVSGMKPSAYAGELLQLAAQFNGRRAVGGVAMAQPSSLETRVKSVLALNNFRKGVTYMDALKVALMGAAATALIAIVRPDVVEAQDAAAPPPPSVAAPAELPPPDAIPTVPDAPPAPPAPPRHHRMHTVQSAQADQAVVDAPPAPPPPPAVQSLPPVPPAPPAPSIVMSDDEGDVDVNVDPDGKTREVHVHSWTDKNGHRHVERSERLLTAAERAQIREEMARARVEVARIHPEIQKAIAAAKIDENVAKAMRDIEPQIRAEIDRAMAEAKPEIRRAIAEAHISEKVMKAIHDAQPKLDAALAKARARGERIRIERVERHGDNVESSVEDRGDGNDDDNDNNGAEH